MTDQQDRAPVEATQADRDDLATAFDDTGVTGYARHLRSGLAESANGWPWVMPALIAIARHRLAAERSSPTPTPAMDREAIARMRKKAVASVTGMFACSNRTIAEAAIDNFLALIPADEPHTGAEQATPAQPARDVEGFEPCPTCRQYSHTLGDDLAAEAALHFGAMFSHRGDGIPTQRMFDDRTRDLVQRLITAIAHTSAEQGAGVPEDYRGIPGGYPAVSKSDLVAEVGKLPEDFPNYGDWSVTLPAGHWRAIATALTTSAEILPADDGALREALEETRRRFDYASDQYHNTTQWDGEDAPDGTNLAEWVWQPSSAALAIPTASEAGEGEP